MFIPLRKGSGIRIKIIEAMSYGIPIITTSKGCEGIYCYDLLISNNAEEMINCLKLLSGSISLRYDLCKREKDFISKYYNKNKVSQGILNVYK